MQVFFLLLVSFFLSLNLILHHYQRPEIKSMEERDRGKWRVGETEREMCRDSDRKMKMD